VSGKAGGKSMVVKTIRAEADGDQVAVTFTVDTAT
jgi:hypothetical protein